MTNRYKEFWNTTSENLSRSLWFPVNPGLVEIPVTNNSAQVYQSWKTFSVNHSENTLIPNVWKTTSENPISQKETRKYRFYPTKEQIPYFYRFFGTTRYFYNKTVEEIKKRFDQKKKEYNDHPTCIFCTNLKEENSWFCINHKDCKPKWDMNINFINLKNSVIIPNKRLPQDLLWQKEIPYDTRVLAVKQAYNAYLSCIANLRNGNIKKFDLKFTHKKKPTKYFCIDKRALKIIFPKNPETKSIELFQKLLKNHASLRFRNKEKAEIPSLIQCDCLITNDRGAFYLILTRDVQRDLSTRVQKPSHMISLDPGVRTFQTAYSDDGTVYKFGEYTQKKIKNLYERIDKFKSLRASSKGRKKRHIDHRLKKLGRKLRNIVKELHNKTARFLVNYPVIILPEFGTSKMQESETLESSTKRMMNSLSPYKFKVLLNYMATKYGSKVINTTEEFTTKSCGCCGKLNDVKGNKIYKCKYCDYECDRDFNGARNIMIKNLTSILG